MFSQDFKELLSAFHEHGVKYLIIGGYAVTLHAPRDAQKQPQCIRHLPCSSGKEAMRRM